MSNSGRATTFQHIELYKIKDMESGAYFTCTKMVIIAEQVVPVNTPVVISA